MTDFTADWERRIAELWHRIDDHDEDAFRERLETLLTELPPATATASFERAAVFDSFGHPERAVPLYREALDAGLSGERRRRAVIQMASSIRLGEPQHAIDLLTAELARPVDHLTGAVRAVLALALADAGRAREGVAVAVTALATYLPRYQRSMARYAAALLDDDPRRPVNRS